MIAAVHQTFWLGHLFRTRGHQLNASDQTNAAFVYFAIEVFLNITLFPVS